MMPDDKTVKISADLFFGDTIDVVMERFQEILPTLKHKVDLTDSNQQVVINQLFAMFCLGIMEALITKSGLNKKFDKLNDEKGNSSNESRN